MTFFPTPFSPNLGFLHFKISSNQNLELKIHQAMRKINLRNFFRVQVDNGSLSEWAHSEIVNSHHSWNWFRWLTKSSFRIQAF